MTNLQTVANQIALLTSFADKQAAANEFLAANPGVDNYELFAAINEASRNPAPQKATQRAAAITPVTTHRSLAARTSLAAARAHYLMKNTIDNSLKIVTGRADMLVLKSAGWCMLDMW